MVYGLFARAATEPRLHPPSPQAIAASVPCSTRLELAEVELKRLRGERTDLDDRIRALAASPFAAHELKELVAQRTKLEGEITTLRGEIAPMRAERGLAVAEALRPDRKDTAQAALAALLELKSAFGRLAEINEAIRRAHGDAA